MRIKLVAIDNGILCAGIRRISALVKSRYPATVTYIYDYKYSVGNVFSNWIKDIMPNIKESSLNKQLISELADADILGVSCLSFFSKEVQELVEAVKK